MHTSGAQDVSLRLTVVLAAGHGFEWNTWDEIIKQWNDTFERERERILFYEK